MRVVPLKVPGSSAERHLVLLSPRAAVTMARILAITNQKGGVGKTTTGVNLAASLAATKQRVLLVDLDPQGNATMGSGVDKRKLKATVYHVLLGEADIARGARALDERHYDLMPANRELAGAEVELVDLEHRETRLKSALAAIAGEYDFILIDCPPALNLLTVNGLCAAARGADPDAMRVLRAGRTVRSGADHQEGARASQSRSCRSRACCAPCSTRATRSRSRSPRSCSSISATRFTAP